MHRYLWGSIIVLLGQISFVYWNLWSPLGAGPAYTFLLLVQYAGIAAGSVLLFFLARAIRRQMVEHRAIRGAAAAVMGLSAVAAGLVLAAAVSRMLQSPAELDLYGYGAQAAGLTWLALVVLGLTALVSYPRPVLPAALLVVLFALGSAKEISLPYSLTGPAGEPDTSYLIELPGGELHPGRIYGLTLWSGTATVADYLFSRINPTTVLIPDAARPQQADDGSALGLMLTDSEAMAKAVGLQVLGRGSGAVPTGAGVIVTRLLPGSPADGLLHPGDLITGFNGVPVTTWARMLEQAKDLRPGVPVTLEVRRSGKAQTLTLTTMPTASDPERGSLGIQGGDQLDYDIPVPITTRIHPSVGGPSLGLALTLQVIDQGTPGGITQGWRVAATGQVLPGGKVGPIGGAQYKVLGAERAGAGVMFVPRENYEAARSGATRIQVVPVDTVQDALVWLKANAR